MHLLFAEQKRAPFRSGAKFSVSDRSKIFESGAEATFLSAPTFLCSQIIFAPEKMKE